MLKRALPIALAVTLCFGLFAACSNDGNDGRSQNDPATPRVSDGNINTGTPNNNSTPNVEDDFSMSNGFRKWIPTSEDMRFDWNTTRNAFHSAFELLDAQLDGTPESMHYVYYDRSSPLSDEMIDALVEGMKARGFVNVQLSSGHPYDSSYEEYPYISAYVPNGFSCELWLNAEIHSEIPPFYAAIIRYGSFELERHNEFPGMTGYMGSRVPHKENTVSSAGLIIHEIDWFYSFAARFSDYAYNLTWTPTQDDFVVHYESDAKDNNHGRAYSAITRQFRENSGGTIDSYWNDESISALVGFMEDRGYVDITVKKVMPWNGSGLWHDRFQTILDTDPNGISMRGALDGGYCTLIEAYSPNGEIAAVYLDIASTRDFGGAERLTYMVICSAPVSFKSSFYQYATRFEDLIRYDFREQSLTVNYALDLILRDLDGIYIGWAQLAQKANELMN